MKLNLIEESINTELEIIIIKNNNIESDNEVLQKLNFKGEIDTSALLPELGKLYIGCGEYSSDNVRCSVAAAMRIFSDTNFCEAIIEAGEYLAEVVEGIELGSYSFTKYKSNKDNKKRLKNNKHFS